MITRRQFMKTAAGTAGALAVSGVLAPRRAHAFVQSPGIPLFKTTLRSIDTIPVAAPDPTPAPVTGVTHYTINISQFTDQITPNLGPTTLWGYHPTRLLAGSATQKHLGGIIVAQRGTPIQITFQNRLPTRNQSWGQIHPLPVDTTIPGANQAQNRAAVHLHGGLVPWISDGGPFDWFDPLGTHGLSFLNNAVLNPSAPLGAGEYYYPMDQSARFLWYHDHAVGITRLNAYAGVATGMLLRDAFEKNLVAQGLPDYIEAGGNEIPLVIQDKIFLGKNIQKTDPTWTGASSQGSLWYAHTYDPDRWEVQDGGLALPDPSAIPEFFGDTMLVNGTAFPQVTVQARRYRFRLLNACNARFLNLQLYVADSSANGITLDANGRPTNDAFINAATGSPSFLQIGTEGGFLSKPAVIPSSVPWRIKVPGWPGPDGELPPDKIEKSLLVAPAERPDLIVDFSGYAGKSVILYSDAPAPYPTGDDANDYFPGLVANNRVNGMTAAGFGPNTRVLMRFNVVAAGGTDLPLTISSTTDLTAGIDPSLVPWGGRPPRNVARRFLTLNEYHDKYGRLIQIVGNAAAPTGSPYDGTGEYLELPFSVSATSENVRNGDTEVWEIYNVTGDTHPMHFHLVNVQLLDRQAFDESAFPNSINFTADPLPPEANELGWKETVQMYPGTVTRVIMKFTLPQVKTAQGMVVKMPKSPRTGGFEYVWHCHILEHEEHDMMHALVVS